MISNRLWEWKFQKDLNILRKTIQINDRDYTVVGTMDEEFGVLRT